MLNPKIFITLSGRGLVSVTVSGENCLERIKGYEICQILEQDLELIDEKLSKLNALENAKNERN